MVVTGINKIKIDIPQARVWREHRFARRKIEGKFYWLKLALRMAAWSCVLASIVAFGRWRFGHEISLGDLVRVALASGCFRALVDVIWVPSLTIDNGFVHIATNPWHEDRVLPVQEIELIEVTDVDTETTKITVRSIAKQRSWVFVFTRDQAQSLADTLRTTDAAAKA